MNDAHVRLIKIPGNIKPFDGLRKLISTMGTFGAKPTAEIFLWANIS